MEESNVYEKFTKEVENENFTKFEEAIAYWIFDLAEALDKNITFEKLKDIISAVSDNNIIIDMIDNFVIKELSEIPKSEVER